MTIPRVTNEPLEIRARGADLIEGSGRLDVPEITDGAEDCTIAITYESRLIDLQTAKSASASTLSLNQPFTWTVVVINAALVVEAL